MVSLRFSDIMISVNRWLSAVDPRRPILVRTESTCDSRTRSWERSSKRCAVTTWSRVAGLRFQSGFETSWSLMPARSSESRSRVRLFVTSPAGPRTGNDGGLQRRSVELRDGDANPRSRNHDATRVSSSHTKVQTFSPHLLRLTFRRLPSVASGRSQDGESSVFNRAGSTLAEAGFGLENGVHPRREDRQRVALPATGFGSGFSDPVQPAIRAVSPRDAGAQRRGHVAVRAGPQRRRWLPRSSSTRPWLSGHPLVSRSST